MQRDMDLIRRILLTVRDKQNLDLEPIKIDGVADIILGRHVEMLFQEGFLEGIEYGTTLASQYRNYLVKDLSWDGHEFIGAVSKDELWQKLKAGIGPVELASQSLKAIKDAAIAVATTYLKGKLGL